MRSPCTRFLVDTSAITLMHALQDYVYLFNTVETVRMFILCPFAPQGVKWEPPKEIDNVPSLEESYVVPQHPESTEKFGKNTLFIKLGITSKRLFKWFMDKF